MTTARHPAPPRPAGHRPDYELVTPDRARGYLATMHRNRTLSKIDRGIMEQNLREGKFWAEISPVYLDAGDRCYDGQHRFQAIAETGISAWLLFIRDVPDEAAEYIDTGRKRTMADALKIMEVPDYKRQSTVARQLALYENYGIDAVRSPSSYPVSRAQMEKWVNAPGMTEAIRTGEGLYRVTGVNPTYITYVVMRTGEAGLPFWEAVRTGDGLVTGDPAKTLRDWLLRAGRKDGRVETDKRLMTLFAITVCWNKHVTGQRYQRVQPALERRRNGQLFFPSASLPDLLPAGTGTKPLEDIRAAYAPLAKAK